MKTGRRAAARLAAPTINLASVVYGLDAYMRAHGADVDEALRRAGLESGDLTDPERRVPLIRYLELLEICAELLADPQFGLKFGAQYEPRHVGVVGNIALASRTVGEAFDTIERYLPTMVDGAVHGMEVNDGIALVYFYYIDPLMMSYRQKGDWVIAFVCNLMRAGLGDRRWIPQEVLLPRLADETPAQRRVRAEIMGDNIQVGHPWAGIRFDVGLLKRPMATADAMIEAMMRHYGDLRLAALPDRSGEIEQLRREIARALVKGEGGIEHLAQATGTSVRTLQRRLRVAGVNYSDLQNDVRKTMALNLLENETLALAEIAFSLGYSEVSAFNHAFRRWVGQSPGDYRRLRSVHLNPAVSTRQSPVRLPAAQAGQEAGGMTGFSLRTLGLPEIHGGDGPIKLNLRKGLALLIYLAEAQGPVARDVIATLLWPESPRETARARLRRMLHRIELTFGQGVFETDRANVKWSPAVELKVDSHLFESACDRGAFEEACATYRGDFLAGFAVADCPEFDDWAFFRREALRGRLMNALERLVQDKNAAGEHFAAAAFAGRLVELDPLSEMYGRYLIRSLLLAGDRTSAERHHAALTQRLRDELGIAPEAETEALIDPAAASPTHAVPTTLYVKGAGVHLAYQTYGSGDLDILIAPGFVSHVERVWEQSTCRAFLTSLMTLGRLILFDRRGIGLSDRVGSAPNVDVTAEDIGTVLRAAHTRRVVLFGASECGPACIKFAVDQPRLVAGLILFGSLAKGCRAPDYPHALQAGQYEAWRRQLVAEWGGPAGIETFGPSLSHDRQARAWWAGLLRAASSPGSIGAVLNALRDTDVRHLLPRVTVPTLVLHRSGDRAVRIGAGRDMASHIPDAQFIELDGDDHWFFAGAQQPVIEAVRRFVSALPRDRKSAR